MGKKGNINYKYLRRRKTWLQRNWKALIITIILILILLAAIGVVLWKFTPVFGIIADMFN